MLQPAESDTPCIACARLTITLACVWDSSALHARYTQAAARGHGSLSTKQVRRSSFLKYTMAVQATLQEGASQGQKTILSRCLVERAALPTCKLVSEAARTCAPASDNASGGRCEPRDVCIPSQQVTLCASLPASSALKHPQLMIRPLMAQISLQLSPAA